MNKSKKVVSLLLSAAMLVSLTACGSSASSSTADASGSASGSATASTGIVNTSEPTYGGEAKIYYQNFNEVFDPAMGESYTYSLWLESLWAPDWGIDDPDTYNFDANVLPADCITGQIADSWDWTVNDDGTSDLTVTIRDDIYFQQKDEEYDVFHERQLTAADVVYSYDRIWGTGTCAGQDPVYFDNSWRDVFAGMIDFDKENPVEQVSDFQLVFHLATDSESSLGTFMSTMVNITGPEWGELTTDQQNDWHYACGTGPYILSDYQADSYYKFTKNENYYDYDERYSDNKLPYLDGITLTAINDTASIMSSFIAGDLDYISLDASLTADQGQQLADGCDGNLQILSYDSNATALALKVNQEPFNDERVRIALQKAINLEEVNDSYYGYDSELQYPGLWIAAMSDWSAVDEWPDDLKDEYSYDPEGAKELLEEAGYPDGFTFTVAIDPSADQDLFMLAQSYFANIGVTMEIEQISDMQAGHEIQGDKDDPRQFNTHTADFETIDAATFNYSTTGFASNNFHNDTNMDDLLSAASSAKTLDETATAAKEADLYFAEQHWVIDLSGTTIKNEYLSSRIGGLSNGERISYSHFTKTFLGRIWNSEAE